MTNSTPIALVTGGSRGIGRATVLALAERGVRSIFTYQSNSEAADDVIASAQRAGVQALALKLDVGASEGFVGFASDLRSALGDLAADRIDYLVNNAGTSHHAAIGEVQREDFDTLFDVHVKGMFLLTQELLPLINDGGKIINLSSALTRIVYPGSAAYASMKAAVETLTRYMAKELGPRRITVNVVAPGAVATDFSGGMVRDNPAVNQQIAAMTALGRVGQPDDIGAMIASLLSTQNDWVNAQRIEASGGASI